MPRDIIITGLDIGTSSVTTAVARVREGLPLQVLAIGESPSAGIKRGMIVDVQDATESVKNSIEDARKISGVDIGDVYLSLGGAHIDTVSSKGTVAVSRADGEISQLDVDRVIDDSQRISHPPNREVVHIIPKEFVVDGEGGLKNVVGMNGVRLEVQTIMVRGSSPFIKTITKCVTEAGLSINDIIVDTLASSYAVLTKRQRELGVLLLDIGGGTTGMSVFEEGDLIHTKIIPVGSNHITNDIAIGLRIGIDSAERIKREYGSCYSKDMRKGDILDLAKIFPGMESGPASRKEISEIIEARFSEIFQLVSKELKDLKRDKLLPAGIVIVGGGAKLPGVVDLAREELMLPAQLGFPQGVEGVGVDTIDDPSYATSLGLVLWALEGASGGGSSGGNFSSLPFSSQVSLGKLRKWFRTFLP